MIKFNTIYNIGDQVFHNTPESDRGIVVDIQYNVLSNIVSYRVVLDIV